MSGLEELIEKMRQTGRSMAQTSFAGADRLRALPSMTREQVDAFDFGVVQVDETGVIKLYNRYEAELAGLTPQSVEGKNFFTQVAPCTNNDIFYGTFRKGLEERDLNVMFLYTFTYKIAPTNVKVHLYRDAATATNWILVKKR
jgi:photoactive yellow protein